MASKQSSRRPANTRSSYSRSTSGRPGGSRSQSRGKKSQPKHNNSQMTGFYKVMAFLAVAGIVAALYLGGHLARWADAITSGELVSGITDMFSETTAASTAPIPVTTTTEPTSTTTTRLTTTTTTATTATTSTIATTTTTAAAHDEQNAKYVKSPNYESPYYIVVFTGSQSVVVYGKDENGYYNVQTKCFTCSSGAPGTPTETGLYSILRSYRWRLLMGDVYGQYCSGFSSSYLFHSVLYEDTDESTLFENSYNNLGKAASHGCIRLCVRDAKWIYDNCPHGTQVRVVNASGPQGESYLPEIKSGSRYRGWEPTDPHEDNPYNN